MESWKPCPGYEDCYAVSSLGRIIRTKGGKGCHAGRIMKPNVVAGYVELQLSKNGVVKHRLVHRLVAEAFYGPPKEGQECNHKDGNKSHNYKENLEWLTTQENARHRVDVLGKRGPVGSKNKHSKKYTVTSPEGMVFTVHGLSEFCKTHKLNQGNLSQAALGKYKQVNGWKCSYA